MLKDKKRKATVLFNLITYLLFCDSMQLERSNIRIS